MHTHTHTQTHTHVRIYIYIYIYIYVYLKKILDLIYSSVGVKKNPDYPICKFYKNSYEKKRRKTYMLLESNQVACMSSQKY